MPHYLSVRPCRSWFGTEARLRPIRTVWGEVGFEELSNGALVAGQPNGSPSWFPCDDHPSSKASYRIQISTDSPTTPSRPGTGVAARPGRPDGVDLRDADPTSTYLATVQIGAYQMHRLLKAPVVMQAVILIGCGRTSTTISPVSPR